MKLPNTLSIKRYLHCSMCVGDIPSNMSPQEYSQLDVGFTEEGLQVWCRRHQVNVAHIHFEGVTHPANTTARMIALN